MAYPNLFGLQIPQGTPRPTGLTPNQETYLRIMGVQPETLNESSSAVPGIAQPTPLDPMEYQRKSILGGQQADYLGGQAAAMREAAGIQDPKLESGLPTQGMLGKALVGALIARLFGDKKGHVAAGLLGGVQQGAQMGAQTRNQNAINEANRNRRVLETEAQILGMQGREQDQRRGEMLGELRYQQNRQDDAAKALREEKKFERQQNDIRGRGERSKFFSANSVAELNSVLDAFQDPAISLYAPSETQIKNKIAEIQKSEADAADKVRRTNQEREIDNFNQGYRSAVSSAAQTVQGWTKELADVWAKKRLILKQSGVPGNALDPIQAPGSTSISKENLEQRKIEGDFSRRMQEKNYNLREQEVLRKVLAEGEKPLKALQDQVDAAKRRLAVLQEQSKKSFDLSIDDKIEKEKATIKVLEDEIKRKPKGPRVNVLGLQPGRMPGKLPTSGGGSNWETTVKGG